MPVLRSSLILLILGCVSTLAKADPIKALILDGQNNHEWKVTTPILKKALLQDGLCTVKVATSPPEGSSKQEMASYRPNFSDYAVVVSNYSGQPWSAETNQALLDYVHGNGGFVVVHAANNAFADWPKYNRMIGLGGWNQRDEKSGPYVYYKDGRVVRDESPGRGGNHGPQHAFQIVIRDANHPITAGLPSTWMHARDELYDSLRGPAVDMRVLATAFSDETQRHEPMILTIRYGNGRVFHTPMGHAAEAMNCAGFQTTLRRGTQWAATGKVSLEIPADFPSASKVSSRK